MISVAVTEDVVTQEEDRGEFSSDKPTPSQNGGVMTEPDDCQERQEEETDTAPRWNFPPVLEDFDLMSSDVDPSQLEEIFEDKR